ncbi:hypothetical protein ACFX13_019222 [Malus domestica]
MGRGICRERSKEAEKMVLRASRPASRLTAVFDVIGGYEARDGGGLWVCIDKLWFCQSHSKAATMAEVQRKKLHHYLYQAQPLSTTTEHSHCTAC